MKDIVIQEVYLPEIPSPALAFRKAGRVFLNMPYYSKLSNFDKKIVKEHEIGHIINNSSDEILADNYAFNRLQGSEFRSLKKLIKGLENTLDIDSNSEHQERYNAMVENAIFIDSFTNKNKNKNLIMDRNIINPDRKDSRGIALDCSPPLVVAPSFKDTEVVIIKMLKEFSIKKGIKVNGSKLLTEDDQINLKNEFLKTKEIEMLATVLTDRSIAKDNHHADSFILAAIIPFIPTIIGFFGKIGGAVITANGESNVSDNNLEAERLRLEAEAKAKAEAKAEAEAKAKQNQMLMIGGGVALFLVVAVVLIFAFKR